MPLSPSPFMRRAIYHATDGTKVEVAQASANESRGTVQRKSQVTHPTEEMAEDRERAGLGQAAGGQTRAAGQRGSLPLPVAAHQRLSVSATAPGPNAVGKADGQLTLLACTQCKGE